MLRPLAAALAVALTLLLSPVPSPAADTAAPLFVNLTTQDPHRATMGLTFGKAQLERGHPLTVFLSDGAVYLGVRSGAETYPRHQALLREMIGKGAQVIACPVCMKHFGLGEADLIEGVVLGNPDLTGAALFRPDTRTVSW